jgi:hypothetical protein
MTRSFARLHHDVEAVPADVVESGFGVNGDRHGRLAPQHADDRPGGVNGDRGGRLAPRVARQRARRSISSSSSFGIVSTVIHECSSGVLMISRWISPTMT